MSSPLAIALNILIVPCRSAARHKSGYSASAAAWLMLRCSNMAASRYARIAPQDVLAMRNSAAIPLYRHCGLFDRFAPLRLAPVPALAQAVCHTTARPIAWPFCYLHRCWVGGSVEREYGDRGYVNC